jgi:hypothetical protein
VIIESLFFRLHSIEANHCSNELRDDLTEPNPCTKKSDGSMLLQMEKAIGATVGEGVE